MGDFSSTDYADVINSLRNLWILPGALSCRLPELRDARSRAGFQKRHAKKNKKQATKSRFDTRAFRSGFLLNE